MPIEKTSVFMSNSDDFCHRFFTSVSVHGKLLYGKLCGGFGFKLLGTMRIEDVRHVLLTFEC